MSMLAGPKRKKQYVLNPRGKPLYNDDDRFGSKMLQKMGWTKGKGLGAKESGSVDFVRVNFKGDAAGLGFEDRNDQWTQHEKGFNGLLETLQAENGSNEDSVSKSSDDENLGTVGFGFKTTVTKAKPKKLTETISGLSLEERSKQSRARVHYKKYTKGKDLAQYSEKDLANIFGKKVNDVERDAENSSSSYNSIAEVAEVEAIESKAEEAIMLKTSATSIEDYFKQKMQQKKAAMQREKGAIADSLSLVQYKEKKLGETMAQGNEKKKKSKNKHEELQEMAEGSDNTTEPYAQEKKVKQKSSNSIQTDCEPLEMLEIIECKKEKKKRRSSVKDAIAPSSKAEESEVQQPQADDAVIRNDNKKKKKKSRSSIEDIGTVNSKTEEADTQQLETACADSKKKKKRKSSMEELIAENLEGEAQTNFKSKKQKLTTNDEATLMSFARTENTKNEKKPKWKETLTTVDVAKGKTTANFQTKRSKNIEENVRFSKHKTVSDPKTINNMQELNNFYCTYQISTFVAEKFRHLDFKKYKSSNLAQIVGYGHDENLRIEIIPNVNDEYRILELWKHSFDKYSDRKLIKEENKSVVEKPESANSEKVNKTTNNKITKKQKTRKGKGFHHDRQNMKRLKRRSVFKLGI